MRNNYSVLVKQVPWTTTPSRPLPCTSTPGYSSAQMEKLTDPRINRRGMSDNGKRRVLNAFSLRRPPSHPKPWNFRKQREPSKDRNTCGTAYGTAGGMATSRTSIHMPHGQTGTTERFLFTVFAKDSRGCHARLLRFKYRTMPRGLI